jgi:hypothetical protein
MQTLNKINRQKMGHMKNVINEWKWIAFTYCGNYTRAVTNLFNPFQSYVDI